MRFRRAVLAGLAAISISRPVRAGDEEDLLRDLERMSQASQGGGTASPAELRELVAQMLPRVAKAMKRPAPARVDVRVISREEAHTRLLAILERDYPGDALSRLAEALTVVGLVAEGTDLRAEAQMLYGGNVSGFYDPHDRALYLLSDQPLAVQSLVVAHELAHAIQDEVLHLEAASRKVRASEDAQLALSAAIEGQAQQVASLVMAEGVGDLGEAGTDVVSLLSEGTAASAAMAGSQSSVPWLGLQLSFPYAAGAGLVQAVRTADDPSATSLLQRLPVSTAQVMNPALYQSRQRPLEATLGLQSRIPGSSAVYATTLGAANLDLFGQLHDAGDLSDGWRGDRLEVVRRQGQLIALWAVAFDDEAQAKRLAQAWTTAVAPRSGVPPGSVHTVRQTGKMAVLLVNVPAEKVAEFSRLADFH